MELPSVPYLTSSCTASFINSRINSLTLDVEGTKVSMHALQYNIHLD